MGRIIRNIVFKIFCLKRTLETSKKKPSPIITVASLGEQRKTNRNNVIWIKQEFYFVIKTENLHLPTDGWISPGRTLWSVFTWFGVNSLFIEFIHSIPIQYLSPYHIPHPFKVLGMFWPRYARCVFSWNLFLVEGSTESVAHHTSNSWPRMTIDL